MPAWTTQVLVDMNLAFIFWRATRKRFPTLPRFGPFGACGLLAAGVSLMLGCAKGLDKTAHLPNSMASVEYQARPVATAWLFANDEAVLSGASIEQILNSRLVIPKPARLAVLPFGQRSFWQWWSEDLSQLSQELEKGSLARLRRCNRLTDVSLLPALMIPEKCTI